MHLFITTGKQRKMLRGRVETCTFELLVTHKWQRQIGPKCIGSSPRAPTAWQLSELFWARDSE